MPDRIKLRSGDFFTEVADEINKQSDLWAAELQKKEELARQIDDLSVSASPDVRAKLENLKGWL